MSALVSSVRVQEAHTVLAWPPPPHDPRERDLVLAIDDWEVRLFAGRKFEYFVSRGFWHLQLWNPEARVSILTPSRLTCGFYESFPVAGWKGRAPTYEGLVALLPATTVKRFPAAARVARVERCLVDAVVSLAVSAGDAEPAEAS